MRPVASAVHLLIDELTEKPGIEEVPAHRSFIEQRLTQESRQRPSEPRPERYRKPRLALGEDLLRQDPLERTFEYQLALAVVPFQRSRNPRGKLQQLMIEERASHFEAVCHRG